MECSTVVSAGEHVLWGGCCIGLSLPLSPQLEALGCFWIPYCTWIFRLQLWLGVGFTSLIWGGNLQPFVPDLYLATIFLHAFVIFDAKLLQCGPYLAALESWKLQLVKNTPALLTVMGHQEPVISVLQSLYIVFSKSYWKQLKCCF